MPASVEPILTVSPTWTRSRSCFEIDAATPSLEPVTVINLPDNASPTLAVTSSTRTESDAAKTTSPAGTETPDLARARSRSSVACAIERCALAVVAFADVSVSDGPSSSLRRVLADWSASRADCTAALLVAGVEFRVAVAVTSCSFAPSTAAAASSAVWVAWAADCAAVDATDVSCSISATVYGAPVAGLGAAAGRGDVGRLLAFLADEPARRRRIGIVARSALSGHDRRLHRRDRFPPFGTRPRSAP